MNHSAREIQDWMAGRLSRLTGVAPEELDPREDIRRYGLDSVALVVFTTDLEAWLGYRFEGNPLEDHTTLESLAAFLAEQTPRGA